MRIAVTGATGFIGRHVLAELGRRRIDAVAAVRRARTLDGIESCAKVVRLDLADSPAESFEALGKPDGLIHLAWGGLPNYRSLHHFERELPLQYRFLSGLVRAGLSSLVVSGTCFEYGLGSGPLSEQMESSPDNPYGLAKDTLRRQLEQLRKVQPFSLAWARLFYLHGDGQAGGSLLPQLRAAVESGRDCFEMSSGEQLRDYSSVEEVARVLVRLASSRADLGVINVCSGRPVSVRRMVEEWIAAQGWNIRLDLGRRPHPDHESLAFWGDRRKLDAFLASSPGTR